MLLASKFLVFTRRAFAWRLLARSQRRTSARVHSLAPVSPRARRSPKDPSTETAQRQIPSTAAQFTTRKVRAARHSTPHRIRSHRKQNRSHRNPLAHTQKGLFPSHRPRLIAQYLPCSSPLYGLLPLTPTHVFLTRAAWVGSETPAPVLSRAPHCWRQSPFAGL